jgi:nucleoside-diphosphate-sugar epimerase
MRLLITSAASPTAKLLADALAADHEVRVTDCVPIAVSHEFALSALGPDASTNLLVRDRDAIVHIADPVWAETPQQRLDYATRCTYNLLTAAAAEGVERVVYISTLELMAPLDEKYIVTERYRTHPTTEPTVLATHLGEMVCREFGREKRISIVTLRLGKLVESASSGDDSALSHADAVAALQAALAAKIAPWSVFHIVSDASGRRFPTTMATRVLGYVPAAAQN